MTWKTTKGGAIIGVVFGSLLACLWSLFSLQTNPPCQCDPAYLCCGAAKFGAAIDILWLIYLGTLVCFLLLNMIPIIIMLGITGGHSATGIGQDIGISFMLFWGSIVFAGLFYLWERHDTKKKK